MKMLGYIAYIWLCCVVRLTDAAAFLQEAAALRGRLARQPLQPPGDVSGVGDVLQHIHQAGSVKAGSVAGELGEMVSNDLSNAAKSAEAAIIDPVGAIGDIVDSAAASMESDWAFPTAAPEAMHVDKQVPESPANVAEYSVTPPTMPPAPYNGVYCPRSSLSVSQQPVSTAHAGSYGAAGAK
eukprot:SRR837773.26977.p1 GENE.SRR837773.26977~~SRR837773.26977.p1  ORF type:complete len:182 (+),score=25.85 SRR837773.26977:69-614(+)